MRIDEYGISLKGWVEGKLKPDQDDFDHISLNDLALMIGDNNTQRVCIMYKEMFIDVYTDDNDKIVVLQATLYKNDDRGDIDWDNPIECFGAPSRADSKELIQDIFKHICQLNTTQIDELKAENTRIEKFAKLC